MIDALLTAALLEGFPRFLVSLETVLAEKFEMPDIQVCSCWSTDGQLTVGAYVTRFGSSRKVLDFLAGPVDETLDVGFFEQVLGTLHDGVERSRFRPGR